MGETVIRHCDFCKQDVDVGFGPAVDLFGVNISVEECVVPVWGKTELVLRFKGELCSKCKGRLLSALSNSFERTKHECSGNAPIPDAKALWRDKKKLRAKPGAKRGSRG